MSVCITFHVMSVANAGIEDDAPTLGRIVADEFKQLMDWIPLWVPDLDEDVEFGANVVIDGDLTVKGDTTLEGDLTVKGDGLVWGDFSVSGVKSAVLKFADGEDRLLHCVEAPVAKFQEWIEAIVPAFTDKLVVPLDPLFVECCEPGSIRPMCILPERPPVGSLGASVENGSLTVHFACSEMRDLWLYVTVAGTRRGVTERFAIPRKRDGKEAEQG